MDAQNFVTDQRSQSRTRFAWRVMSLFAIGAVIATAGSVYGSAEGFWTGVLIIGCGLGYGVVGIPE